jgi:hypothetical protein
LRLQQGHDGLKIALLFEDDEALVVDDGDGDDDGGDVLDADLMPDGGVGGGIEADVADLILGVVPA